MADYPIDLTNAVPEVTPIMAKHINNLEAKVGTDDSPVATSLDYRVGMLDGQNTGLGAKDHDPADGSHIEGGWRIGLTTVTAKGAEVNQALDGIGPTVTAANLTSLTDGSSIGDTLHSHGMATRYLTTFNGVNQLSSRSNWRKVDLGTIVKNSGITIATNVITLLLGYKYVLSYSICFVSEASTPAMQGRFAVVAGDSTWTLESVSHTQTELYHSYSENCTNNWVGIMIPSVDTQIQLEVITESPVGQYGYVNFVSTNIWTIF